MLNIAARDPSGIGVNPVNHHLDLRWFPLRQVAIELRGKRQTRRDLALSYSFPQDLLVGAITIDCTKLIGIDFCIENLLKLLWGRHLARPDQAT